MNLTSFLPMVTGSSMIKKSFVMNLSIRKALCHRRKSNSKRVNEIL